MYQLMKTKYLCDFRGVFITMDKIPLNQMGTSSVS